MPIKSIYVFNHSPCNMYQVECLFYLSLSPVTVRLLFLFIGTMLSVMIHIVS